MRTLAILAGATFELIKATADPSLAAQDDNAFGSEMRAGLTEILNRLVFGQHTYITSGSTSVITGL